MQATRVLWQHRQPMIRFLGKRSIPKRKGTSAEHGKYKSIAHKTTDTSTTLEIDHSPHVHPAAPDQSLPESFAQYRNRAIQHGPLGGQQPQSSAAAGAGGPAEAPIGHIGGQSAKQLGPITLSKGEVWDRSELPARFRRKSWTLAEMEAVDSGGASLFA